MTGLTNKETKIRVNIGNLKTLMKKQMNETYTASGDHPSG